MRHPEVLARCRETGDDEYLTAVVNETLRARPVIDSAARKRVTPLELGGYRLPAGTLITASIRGVQQSPGLYPKPHRSQPERFLERNTYVYMLVYDRTGTGPPLLFLHGTNSSRSIWSPLLPALSDEREVLAVDLPAHGQSPPTSFTPREWAREVAALLDELRLERVPIVGHSSGGWTALELAKLERASAVLALAPAGLWRRHSPLITDTILNLNWRMGQLLGEQAITPLRARTGRRVALRQVSARAAAVSEQDAITAARAALASKQFPEHFKQTRRLRFLDGQSISPNVPIRIVWGAQDHIARTKRSRHTDQLPQHATIETWPHCGHMLTWDNPQAVIDAALALSTPL